MIRCILVAGVLLFASGCRPEADSDQTPVDTSDVVASSADGETGDAAPPLTLDPEGLRIVNAATGSTQVLMFGMDEEEAVAAVARLRGTPAHRGVDTECGEAPLAIASWPDGLSLHSSEGRFSGWGVNGNADGADQYTTTSGIGVGSTRAELEDAYDIRTGETSLGTEFAAGGLHGVLTGSGSNAEITSLWGGSACIFR